MKNSPEILLHLTMAQKHQYRFLHLLEKGFNLKVLSGSSIAETLCRQMGIKRAYLDQRIQTIFLNGKPVDDIHTALPEEGSVLALSAAMPGLVGATMRRGGKYASLRNDISHTAEATLQARKTITVTLKLFNLMRRELGPLFLEKGIRVNGDDLSDIFARDPEAFVDGSISAKIDGRELGFEDITGFSWKGREVILIITNP
jgi:hypothetical protein